MAVLNNALELNNTFNLSPTELGIIGRQASIIAQKVSKATEDSELDQAVRGNKALGVIIHNHRDRSAQLVNAIKDEVKMQGHGRRSTDSAYPKLPFTKS